MKKNRTEAIQKRAMEIVQIRPLSDEAQRLIDEALQKLELDPEGNRYKAFDFLHKSGGFDGVDIGGDIINHDTAVATLMREFDCVKQTARNHVARAARRKHHPDYRAPVLGGRRAGAGSPQFTDEQVRDMRQMQADGASYSQIAEKFGTDAGNAYRIVNRKTYKHVE